MTKLIVEMKSQPKRFDISEACHPELVSGSHLIKLVNARRRQKKQNIDFPNPPFLGGYFLNDLQHHLHPKSQIFNGDPFIVPMHPHEFLFR